MINTLPQALIESVTRVIYQPSSLDGAGIRMRNFPYGEDIDIHIRGNGYRYNGEQLDEAITDWFKSTKRYDPSEFNDMSKEHAGNLSDDEKNAVRAYTYNSDPIKEHIRNGNDNNLVHIHDVAGNIVHTANLEHLDSAISKNKLKEDFITYSGISKNPWECDMKHVGFSHSSTPMSSSTDPVVSHNFALSYHKDGPHNIAKIFNYKGQSGLYVGHNQDLTPTPAENEFIAPKNTTYRVGIEPEVVKDNDGNITHHIWNYYRAN